jgi:hypothetical protein
VADVFQRISIDEAWIVEAVIPKRTSGFKIRNMLQRTGRRMGRRLT